MGQSLSQIGVSHIFQTTKPVKINFDNIVQVCGRPCLFGLAFKTDHTPGQAKESETIGSSLALSIISQTESWVGGPSTNWNDLDDISLSVQILCRTQW